MKNEIIPETWKRVLTVLVINKCSEKTSHLMARFNIFNLLSPPSPPPTSQICMKSYWHTRLQACRYLQEKSKKRPVKLSVSVQMTFESTSFSTLILYTIRLRQNWNVKRCWCCHGAAICSHPAGFQYEIPKATLLRHRGRRQFQWRWQETS